MIADYRKMPQNTPPSYPPAGSWFTDQAFGQKILRVTDERDGKRCTNAYSYWPALNCDSTRLLIARDDVPWVYQWPEGDSFQLCGAGDPPLQFEGATWSSTEPNVLKALGRDGVLYRYNVSKVPGQRATAIASLGEVRQLTASSGGTVFGCIRNYKGRIEAMVYSSGTGHQWTFKPPLTTDLINEIAIARSGIRAVVHLEPRSGEKEGRAFLWDFRRDIQVELPNATGHWDIGAGIMVNGDGQQTGIQCREYNVVSRGAFVPDVVRSNVLRYVDRAQLNWNIADHVSLAQDERSILVSTYGKTVGNSFEHEIFLVNISGGFQRFCGTHSKYFARAPETKALRYYDEPHAVLSMDGRWAIWTSNLGNDKRWDVLATRIGQ